MAVSTGAALSDGAAARPRHVSIGLAAVQPITFGLDQPKKVTIEPGGTLLVAASGNGLAPASCTNGAQRSCLDASGEVDRVTQGGAVTAALSGLPSISSGATAGEAAGPAEARATPGGIVVIFQDQDIAARTGRETFGAAGSVLGELVRYRHGRARTLANFGPFEARHRPDHGAGTDVALGLEPAIDSDPYAFVPYRDGWAVADAGADDVLFVSSSGKISVLAVLPTIRERAVPGAFGPRQRRAIVAQAQPVPDSLAVGPDGALYVGELGGTPYDVGASRVYRIVPGHAPTVYARGLTSISDIAFDRRGRLLVLEIDTRGLRDPALLAGRTPAPGAVIRVDRGGTRKTAVVGGLGFPTGMAVAADGSIYVVVGGIASPITGAPDSGGGIVHVRAAGL